jgi:hypothetical protein
MKVINTILISFLFYATIQAGPWPKNAGTGYFKLSEWWIIADQHYTDTGDIDPNVTNGFFNTSLYGEYGFTDKLTGTIYFPFFSRAYYNNTVSGTTGEVLIPGESINSIGDAELGITYGIYQAQGLSVSISAVIGLPLGKDMGGSLNSLQTGDGEFNQALKMEVGKSFSLANNNGWVQASIAYNNRTQGFSDEVIAGFQLGFSFLNGKLIPSIRFENRSSRFNGDPDLSLNFTSVFSNNTEYFAFTPELNYLITDKLGVSIATGRVFSGSVIFANPSYSVGVFYDMK